MLFLGIETSCDETAAALVDETGAAGHPWRIRANVVASQADIHREWGGVVPELASRQHVRDICGVVERALEQGHIAGGEVDEIGIVRRGKHDAVANTFCPELRRDFVGDLGLGPPAGHLGE